MVGYYVQKAHEDTPFIGKTHLTEEKDFISEKVAQKSLKASERKDDEDEK